MKDIVIEILTIIATTAIPAILAWVGMKINEYAKNNEKEYIVKKVVEYVEQTCSMLESNDKYNEAYEKSAEWLAEKGIKISETELQVLIESSVMSLTKGMKGKEETKNVEQIQE